MKTKSLISSVLIVLFFIFVNDSVTYAQRNRKSECKYEMDQIDDFSKNRIVRTVGIPLFDVKPSAAQVLLGLGGGRVAMNVVGSNINGANGLEFDWLSINEKVVKLFNQVDLLLENGDIITFKEEKESDLANKHPWYFSYKLFGIKNDSIWNKLKSIPLKKIKLLLDDKEIGNTEIEEKYSTCINKVVSCIDILGIETIKSFEMTSDEAMTELRKAKDKLELEIITQEKYDSLKVEYMKFIK